MRSLTLDDKIVKGNFTPSKAAENDFYRSLKKVAEHASRIVEYHLDGLVIKNSREMEAELERYAEKIEPWAVSQSARLLERVQKSNKWAYTRNAKTIAAALKLKVAEANVDAVARALMAEQVALIKSIPIEAGERAQKIAFEAAMHGTRAQANEDTIEDLQEQMGMTREVATSRAKLIAVTETARANAAINQARAISVGSRQYRWHNSADGAVRESHRTYRGKRMQGLIFSWDDPPTLDDGTRGHPGTFPRCRCFAEPVFDDG